MKTISPIALRRLMDVSRIELIDVRRQDDFRKVHAFGARSVPLRRFEPHSVLAHRNLDRGAPLYLMCDKSMLASAAAGSLSGAGFDKSIVVQGGLEAWLEQGMLVVRPRTWRSVAAVPQGDTTRSIASLYPRRHGTVRDLFPLRQDLRRSAGAIRLALVRPGSGDTHRAGFRHDLARQLLCGVRSLRRHLSERRTRRQNRAFVRRLREVDAHHLSLLRRRLRNDGRHAREPDRAGEARARCAGEQRTSLRQRTLRLCFYARARPHHAANDPLERRMEERLVVGSDRVSPRRSCSGTCEKHGPDSIGMLGSARATNEENYLAQKFARVVLGTNNIDCCARVCHAPTAAAMKTMLGTGAATNSFDDIEAAGAFLLCGTNATENHPIVGARIKQAVLRGAKLIVIDPRKIELTRYADNPSCAQTGHEHPAAQRDAPAPSSRRTSADENALKERVGGWNEFREFIGSFAAEKVADLCKRRRASDPLRGTTLRHDEACNVLPRPRHNGASAGNGRRHVPGQSRSAHGQLR